MGRRKKWLLKERADYEGIFSGWPRWSWRPGTALSPRVRSNFKHKGLGGRVRQRQRLTRFVPPHFSGERVRNSFCAFHFFQLHTATLLLGTAVSLVGLKGSWSPCLAGLLTGGGLTHQQDSLISFKVTHRSLRRQLRPLKPVSGCWGALPEHQPAPLFVSILPWANETLWPCSQWCLKHSEGP